MYERFFLSPGADSAQCQRLYRITFGLLLPDASSSNHDQLIASIALGSLRAFGASSSSLRQSFARVQKYPITFEGDLVPHLRQHHAQVFINCSYTHKGVHRHTCTRTWQLESIP
jgi:hypothetical protein